MDTLEKDRAAMSVFEKPEAYGVCKKFADNVFARADNEDRNGTANKATAMSFYVSRVFYEILEQFGDHYLADLEQCSTRRKYAGWKAAQIQNCLKTGERIVPGGAGEEEEGKRQEEELYGEGGEGAADDDSGFPEVPTGGGETDTGAGGGGELKAADPFDLPAAPLGRAAAEEYDDDNAAFGGGENKDESKEEAKDEAPPAMAPPAVVPPAEEETNTSDKKSWFSKPAAKSDSSGGVSKADIADAVELAKFSIAAMQGNEIELAKKRLKEALKLLG